MEELGLKDFWDNEPQSSNDYMGPFPSDELIASIEEELGYKLPAFYIKMMKIQNGGYPERTCFPTEERTSWAVDHVAITGIMGIGRDKDYTLCGPMGSQFIIEDWDYPAIGVCICDCPSAGHDMIMLDYRKNGKDGEPEVVHVDQEYDYAVTFLAPDFETFIRGLVDSEEFEDEEDDY